MSLKILLTNFRLTLMHCALLASLASGAQSDTTSHIMKGVEVVARRNSSGLYTDARGESHVSMTMLRNMPQILSNTDPLRFAQALPGVQTNRDFDSGLHIQGCSTGQSMISMDGVVIYNPAHMLGFFSTFITSHFHDFSLQTTTDALSPNIMGGILDMHLASAAPDSIRTTIDVGILSSQATLRLPTGKEHGLSISARQCYFDLIYGKFAKLDEYAFGYTFGDYNLSYWGKIGRNKLQVNAYFGRDKVKLSDDEALGTKFNWQNFMASATLTSQPSSKVNIKHKLWYSGMNCLLNLDMLDIAAQAPSSIHTLAYQGYVAHHVRKKIKLDYVLDFRQHWVQPQNVEVDGPFHVENKPSALQHATEAFVALQMKWLMSHRLSLQLSSKFALYASWGDHPLTTFYTDPSLRINYDTDGAGSFFSQFARSHQYLHHVGITSNNMPVEFRLAANKQWQPQEALGLTFGWSKSFFNGLLKTSVEAYGKRLRNQIEYLGSPMDFVTTGYDLDKALISGDGWNYGINLQVVKQTGRVTGWVSYAYNQSIRHFESLQNSKYYYPSIFERPHELTAVASWNINRHWSIGGTFTYATGTPFTPVRQLYLVHSTLVSEYAEYNSGRLRPYSRLDLSGNYSFRWGKHADCTVNLSLFNALNYINEMYYGLKVYKRNFSYTRSSLFLPILPSIGFSVNIK